MSELAKSPYRYLLDDVDFKRWFNNVKRGSVATAYEWLRRIGYIHKTFGKSPKEIASLSPKDATNFILDIVSTLEEQGRGGNYIANCVKPLKSWLEFNGIRIQQRIKISGRGELIRFADERPPMPDELKKIFNIADLRARVACALVAFSGFRLEVLGDYLGNDGLKICDFPEMRISNGTVEFEQIPTMIMVRKSLSKTGNQFFTFLCEEGCEYLKEYLEWRMRRNEKLSSHSPIITPNAIKLAGQHIRTINIGDLIRKPIRAAGFSWRPYVLRRYFDTRMMMAESDGLVIRDYRTFWMGHKGDIEHTYTVNKALSKDVIEKMHESYAKASEKYLMTIKREEVTKASVLETFNRQFLKLAGYTDEEINQLGDLSQLTSEQVQELIRKKSMQALGLNGNSKQKVVPMNEIKHWILQGWEFVATLPTNEAIIKLPKNS
jgi:hypothetical protein